MNVHIVGFTLFAVCCFYISNANALSVSECSNAETQTKVEGLCLAFKTAELSHPGAEATCRSMGGHLVMPKSPAIQHAVEVLNFRRTDEPVWIGVIRHGNEFLFMDGENVTTTYWRSGEPNRYTADEDCVENDLRRQWNDIRCRNARAFICQFNLKVCDWPPATLNDETYAFPVHCTNATKFFPREEINYECANGLSKKGSPFVTCQEDGSWTEPECVKACPDPTVPQHSFISNPEFMYKAETKLLITCDDGYFYPGENFLRTSTEITCTSNGTWTTSSAKCIPLADLNYTYTKTTAKLLIVETSGSISLDCAQLKNNEKDYSQQGTPLKPIWTKDQVDIKNLQGKTKTIIFGLGNGQLLIRKFSKDGEGLYTCFAKGLNADGDIVMAVTTYRLVDNTQCPEQLYLVKPDNTVATEGSSVVLHCAAKSSYTTWYKDGNRIWGNSNYQLLPDGSLFVDRASQENEGNYICQVTTLDSKCSSNTTFKVTVKPKFVKITKNFVCGQTDHDFADLTSNSTDISMAPWFVSLWWMDESGPFCYGTIIGSNWIITSATCVFGVAKRHLQLLYANIGENVSKGRTDKLNEANEMVGFQEIIVHPNFRWGTLGNDIALIKLQTPIPWSRYVKPICIAKDKETMERDPCDRRPPIQSITTGLGILGDPSATLTFGLAQIDILRSNPCEANLHIKLPNSVFCYAIDSNQTVSDVGSPLFVWNDGQAYLYGITLTPINNFSLYLTLSGYLQWLHEILDDGVQ